MHLNGLRIFAFVDDAPRVERRRPRQDPHFVVAVAARREDEQLIAATGWLPHTTRAALTGLRQKGFVLDRSKGEDGRAVYRIVDQERNDSGAGRAA